MTWQLPPGDTYFAPILAKTPAGFELDHLEVALKHVQRWRLAIDGGAHIGTWSVALANRFGRVMAFEPAYDTYLCLTANVLKCSNVAAYPAALGPFDGHCEVIEDRTRPGNTGSRQVVPSSGSGVRMVALDGFKFKDLDFLKLDLEGFEVEALKGSILTIAHCQPVIMVECKKFVPPRWGGPEATVGFLTQLGYREVGGINNDRVFVWG